MQEVSSFCLFNQGGFATAIQLFYQDEHGAERTVRASELFPVMERRQVCPGDHGIPDGTVVNFGALVIAGRDARAPEPFVYRAATSRQAHFTITGATLANELKLDGVFPEMPQIQPWA